MITAILLASGFSRRLQTDKLTLDFHGHPLIEYTMAAVSGADFNQKLLVQRSDTFTMLAQQYGFQSLQNSFAANGQCESIRLGVAASSTASAYMFFVGDQPGLTTAIINVLLEKHRQYPDRIIVPTCQEQPRNPVIFPHSLRDPLLALTGDSGGRSVIRQYPHLIHHVPFSDPLPFSDIDTQEDYESLKQLISHIEIGF